MKPILFNTEMVQAILDGRKTVTRRVIKPKISVRCNQDKAHKFEYDGFSGFICSRCGCGVTPLHSKYPVGSSWIRPPYKIGDVLWVRETWLKADDRYHYKADVKVPSISEDLRKEYGYKWHPSIHMPKEAARIFLKVIDVRVERLQEITEEQAKMEGFEGVRCHCNGTEYACTDCYNSGWQEPPFVGFMYTWDSTIKKQDLDTYGWDANPWVWVIEFERIEKGGRIMQALFRGKRKDNGKWVYWNIYGIYTKPFHTKFEAHGDVREYDIIPETVGQWTGRLTEEEKKIFDGDKCILTTFDYNGLDTQHEVVVEYLGGAFYFVNDEKEFYMCVAEVEDTESDVEVIGNIHDNPAKGDAE